MFSIFFLITSFFFVGGYSSGTVSHHLIASSSISQDNSVYTFITSSYSGANQILAINPGDQGEMIYQNVNVSIFTSSYLNYTIYVNGNVQKRGNVSGFTSYLFQATGSKINIDVFIGTSSSFLFNNEIILHQSIQSLFSPKPPPLVASFLDELFALLKGVIAIFPVFILGYISLKPIIVNRKNRTPVVW